MQKPKNGIIIPMGVIFEEYKKYLNLLAMFGTPISLYFSILPSETQKDIAVIILLVFLTLPIFSGGYKTMYNNLKKIYRYNFKKIVIAININDEIDNKFVELSNKKMKDLKLDHRILFKKVSIQKNNFKAWQKFVNDSKEIFVLVTSFIPDSKKGKVELAFTYHPEEEPLIPFLIGQVVRTEVVKNNAFILHEKTLEDNIYFETNNILALSLYIVGLIILRTKGKNYGQKYFEEILSPQFGLSSKSESYRRMVAELQSVYSGQAYDLIFKKKYPEAEKILNKSLSYNRGHLQTISGLSKVRCKLGDMKGSREMVDELLKYGGVKDYYLINNAYLYLISGDYPNAISNYKKIFQNFSPQTTVLVQDAVKYLFDEEADGNSDPVLLFARGYLKFLVTDSKKTYSKSSSKEDFLAFLVRADAVKHKAIIQFLDSNFAKRKGFRTKIEDQDSRNGDVQTIQKNALLGTEKTV